jgi:hypothetical protein
METVIRHYLSSLNVRQAPMMASKALAPVTLPSAAGFLSRLCPAPHRHGCRAPFEMRALRSAALVRLLAALAGDGLVYDRRFYILMEIYAA